MPNDDKGFKFFTVEHVSKPFNGAEVIVDAYWLTNQDGDVAVYRGGSPQCNVNENVAKLLMASSGFEWAVGYTQIPLAFVGIKNGTFTVRGRSVG